MHIRPVSELKLKSHLLLKELSDLMDLQTCMHSQNTKH